MKRTGTSSLLTNNMTRDAGLVLSSYIASLPHLTPSLSRLPILETSLSHPDLNILELGAGCGIVGITLSRTLPHPSQILLTDLPEAAEILTHNLSPSILPPSRTKIFHQVLDWSCPFPPTWQLRAGTSSSWLIARTTPTSSLISLLRWNGS